MSKPQTLLSMAGADMSPSTLSNSVLILIDCQQEYVNGLLPLKGVEAALSEIALLLEKARKQETPIIHIAHKGSRGGMFDRSHGGKGIFAELAMPLQSEEVIEKSLPNSFTGTSLETQLKKIDRAELILCGFMTHMCVNSTARAALDLGYRTTIVSKACATRDLPGPSGGILNAELVHEASLAGLADRYSIIVDTVSDIPD